MPLTIARLLRAPAGVATRARKLWYRARYRRVRFPRRFGLRGSLIIRGPGTVEIGEECFFDNMTGRPNKILTFSPEARVVIGDHCYLNGFEIACKESVTVGPRCIIADCLILDTDFHSIERDRHDPAAHVVTRPVEIGTNVWIGNRTIVLKGVKIGENAVVGAGAVVRKSVPGDVVVAGNPAQIVKNLASRSPSAAPTPQEPSSNRIR
jgi:acetyltransferase-like isoleucine patch superfamily enzyme